MAYYRRKHYRKRADNNSEIFFNFILLCALGLLGIYLSNRATFWSIIIYALLALFLYAAFLIFMRQLRKKRRRLLVEKAKGMGFDPEINNFISSFGLGQDKSYTAFEYRNYRIDWHRINEFRDSLGKRGLKIKPKDFVKVLIDYIDDREYKRTIGGAENVPKHLSDLNGTEFEGLLCRLFEKMGYIATHTGHAGDQGADLIIQRGQERTVVQAKAYKEWRVGNDAVQQIIGAKNFYNCNGAMVITTNEFTREAIELAKSSNVKLVHGRELQKMLLDNLGENWI